MNKWSEGLPQDVFDRILNLCSFLDSVQVGFVCKSWHRASNLNMIRRPQLPWLMMPSNLCVFSLSNNTFYKMPQIRGKRFRGSFINSGGWLMSIDRNMEVQLFHPWRRIHLNLPPFSISNVSDVCPDCDSEVSKPTIIKAAMSDDAAVVAVIDSPHSIAFCRTGEDMIWTRIADTHQGYAQRYRDIIYSKGHFYTVGWDGAIGVQNINTTNPYVEPLTGGVKRIFTKAPPLFMRTENILYDKGRFYTVRSDGAIGGVINLYGEPQRRGVKFISRKAARLLHSDGEISYRTYLVPDLASESLFIVKRFAEVGFDGPAPYVCATYGFQVFELQEGEGKPVEVDSFGDRVMFLGLNSSMIVMASRFSGLEGNRIYFTDDWAPWQKLPSANADMGIFNMEDRTIRPLFPNIAHPSFLPPIWITPPPLV